MRFPACIQTLGLVKMVDTPPNMVTDLLIGRTIGNYVVKQKIGEGGMGAVYFAEHPAIGKRVALKVLHPEYAAQPEIVSRFFNEAKAVNDIQHANIVDIIDFGTIPALHAAEPPMVYFTMELIHGISLSELIRRETRLPVERALGIAMQIADALAASHRVGIVHRDLKPDNVMLVQRGREHDFVKLLDFGIAKLVGTSDRSHRTRTGMVMGTPQYMSPEQCEGRGSIDLRTDVYALGVVLYQMLTGKVPFVGEGLGEIFVQQMAMPPLAPSVLNPQIPPQVELVVLKALEKRPENRYPDMNDMMAALHNPAAFIEAHGSSAGFLASPMLRDPSMSGTGPAIALLTPAGLRGQVLPTTLSGAPGEMKVAPARRRSGLMIGLGVVLAGLAGAIAVGVTRSAQTESENRVAAPPDRRDPLEPGPTVARAQVPPVGSPPSQGKLTPPPSEPAAARVEPAAARVDAAAAVVESHTVKLDIDSTPAGAKLTVGGVVRGTTPFHGEIDRGTGAIEIKLELAGHDPMVRKIEPRADVVLSLSLQKMRPRKTPAPAAPAAPPAPAASAGPTPPAQPNQETRGPDDMRNPFDHLKKENP